MTRSNSNIRLGSIRQPMLVEAAPGPRLPCLGLPCRLFQPILNHCHSLSKPPLCEHARHSAATATPASGSRQRRRRCRPLGRAAPAAGQCQRPAPGRARRERRPRPAAGAAATACPRPLAASARDHPSPTSEAAPPPPAPTPGSLRVPLTRMGQVPDSDGSGAFLHHSATGRASESNVRAAEGPGRGGGTGPPGPRREGLGPAAPRRPG